MTAPVPESPLGRPAARRAGAPKYPTNTPTVWREPAEETLNLYPGLVVHDGRHSGSITIGRSRLPVAAIIPDALSGSWDAVGDAWDLSARGYTEDALTQFICDVLELRGEFARLILELANVERIDRNARLNTAPWWERPRLRRRVVAQLQRCLAMLDDTTRKTANRVGLAEDALRLTGTRCENRTQGRCSDESARTPDAKYTADRWCNGCIAAEALGTRKTVAE